MCQDSGDAMGSLIDLTKTEIFWSAVQGIGSLATALIAYFVFREARSIRRIEWAFNAVGKWQEFNRVLVEADAAERWETICTGSPIEPSVGPSDKRLFLMYFNIQMIEFYLMRKRIVPRHAIATMKSELRMFSPHMSFLLTVLDDGGYDPAYVRFVKSCFVGGR
jgi:hypothetical protein